MYRLKSRQAGSVITLMEIDTESRAWYIKADHKEAALKALKDMGPALACVETIYINGDDVSSVVCARSAHDGSGYAAGGFPAAGRAHGELQPCAGYPCLPDR